MSKNELVVADAFREVLANPAGVLEAMRENVGNQPIRAQELARIKIPAGGGKAWELPDGKVATEFSGVVIYAQDSRAYWKEGLDDGAGAGKPPDCASDDAETGHGDPGGACAHCPLAEFGSDGRGQACKQVRLLFVLLPGELLPVVVSLPPTSLKPARSFMLRLASKGVPYYGVVTKFLLEGTKNPEGIDYSVVKLEVAEKMDTEGVAKFRKVRDAYAPLFQATKADAEDFSVKDSGPREPGVEG